MHKIRSIRDNINIFDDSMKKRRVKYKGCELIALDKIYKSVTKEIQEIQQQRNIISNSNSVLDKESDDYKHGVIEGNSIKNSLFALIEKRDVIKKKLDTILVNLPNILDKEILSQASDQEDVVIKTYGEPKNFHFCPLGHDVLAKKLGLVDFDTAVKISGARFVILKDTLAKLERVLVNFMLDINVNSFQYREIAPPFLVSSDAMFKAGQLPKFEQDSFKTNNDYRLIPTAEVPLIAMMSDQMLSENEFPIRFTAATPCFRSEAGSVGTKTQGMFRLHQFTKVEIVSAVLPDKSEFELKRMLSVAETILQKLKIPYRVVMLSANNTGFCSKKTYDIEVWMPSQNKYQEVSSCSDCGDFQAIRMNSRYKSRKSNKKHYFHTLNASSLAVGRTIMAIIENGQNENGRVIIPDVLRPYMNNAKYL